MTKAWAVYRDGKYLFGSDRGTKQEVELWAVVNLFPNTSISGNMEKYLATLGVKIVKINIIPAGRGTNET